MAYADNPAQPLTDSRAMPVGSPLADTRPADPPRRGVYEGPYVRLAPVEPSADAGELYAGAHGDEASEQLWTYMPYGPFEDATAMESWLHGCAESDDPLFLTVHRVDSGQPVGMVSFLNFAAAMRTVELVHIWYHSGAQRGRTNTESVYLMLREAFEAQRIRRAEW